MYLLVFFSKVITEICLLIKMSEEVVKDARIDHPIIFVFFIVILLTIALIIFAIVMFQLRLNRFFSAIIYLEDIIEENKKAGLNIIDSKGSMTTVNAKIDSWLNVLMRRTISKERIPQYHTDEETKRLEILIEEIGKEDFNLENFLQKLDVISD